MTRFKQLRLKYLLLERDERLGRGESALLGLSKARGLLPRAELGDSVAVAESLEKYKRVSPGELVMNKMQAWNGVFGLSRYEGVVSPDYTVLRPAGEPTDPRYLEYVLRSPFFSGACAGVARGMGTAFLRVNTSDLLALKVPYPPLDQQRAISAFLDRECDRIGALARLLGDHGGAGIELERRVVDDLFADLSLTRLGWRAHVQTGLTLGGHYADEKLAERPYLRVANVQANAITTTDLATVRVPARVARRTTLHRGDVLMTEGGDIDKLGRGAVWEGSIPDCLHQNHVFAVRCGERLMPEFLAVWTRSSVARSYFERTASRITNIASTNRTKLLRLPVPDIPIAEQRARLDAFSREHRHLVELREESAQLATGLAEYREALITEAVTGTLAIDLLSEQQLKKPAHATSAASRAEILTS